MKTSQVCLNSNNNYLEIQIRPNLWHRNQENSFLVFAFLWESKLLLTLNNTRWYIKSKYLVLMEINNLFASSLSVDILYLCLLFRHSLYCC